MAEKKKIKTIVLDNKSKIYLLLDIQTLSSNKSIMKIIIYYILSSGVLVQTMLVIREIKDNYKGKSLALVFIKVICDWGIISKLNYIVIDNTPNNNIIIFAFSIRKYFI